MKKVLAVVLAMVFIVSVCSCSEHTSQSGEGTTTTTTQTAITSITTAPTTTATTTTIPTTTTLTTTIPTTTARPKAEIWYENCAPARGNTTLNPDFDGSIEITRRMGMGVSHNKVTGPVAGALVLMLENLKVTGEVGKVTETNIMQQAVGTVLLEINGITYRITPQLYEIYRVDNQQGKEYGLKMTDEFSDELRNTLNYWPYYSYSGIYQDNVLRYRSAYAAETDVKFTVKDIYIEKNEDPNNYIELEVTSSVDKKVSVSLACEFTDCLRCRGDGGIMDLKSGKAQTIRLNFGGGIGRYYVTITADKTRFNITVTP